MVLSYSLSRNKSRQYLMIAAIIVGVTILINILPAERVSSLSVDKICGNVEVVYARGSGQDIDVDESVRFREQLTIRASLPVRVNFYELGSETYNGYKYPAINIGEWWKNGNIVGASLSAGLGNDYGKSVDEGVRELQAYLTQRNSRCPNAHIILGGYSQGSQVVGQALSGLSASVQAKIDFIALFGDPKLHLPEGEGFYPPACRGLNFSEWRRVAGSCELHSGALGSRQPYLPEAMKNKTGLWCNRNDFICGSTRDVWSNDGHAQYKNIGGAIDQAAVEAANRLKVSLPVEMASSIQTTKTASGMGTSGEDTLIVFNYLGWTYEEFERAKKFIESTTIELNKKGVRTGLAVFDGDKTSLFLSSSGVPTLDPSLYLRSLREFEYREPDQPIKPVLRGLISAMDSFYWTLGASKSIILVSNTDFYNPDGYDTFATVAKRALEIDPVNIFALVSDSLRAQYENITTSTSGKVIVFDDISENVKEVIDEISLRPTALLKNVEYSAQPGQEILFDASLSYLVNGEITKYEWDFNGDGIFEEISSTPYARHVYEAPFKGNIQVQLTGSNNKTANASAIVKVGMHASPAFPAKPINVTAKVISTKEKTSVVGLEWQSGDEYIPVASWVVSMNGVVLGKIERGKMSIQVTDVSRENDVQFGLAGVSEYGQVGESQVVVLERVTPPTNTPSAHPILLLLQYLFSMLRRLIIGV